MIAGTNRAGIADLRQALGSGLLHLRIMAMLAAGPGVPESPARAASLGAGERIRIGAIKILQDGSLQGYTGYLTAPYYKQPEGKSDYRGYAHRTKEELVRMVLPYHRAGYQIAIHGNGDAAIDDVLSAYREAQREFPRADARHRIEHCQTAREDQLDAMRELGVTPSFFVGHVYYWGRSASRYLSWTRAGFAYQPASFRARPQMRFTVHDDTPVTPANPLMLVWDAVNRLTLAGQVLGAGQRIGTLEALRAVTSAAAWQNFEEKRKGSIEPSKLADFVVLDRNPLAVPPAEIRNVNVVETIVGGQTVYRRYRILPWYSQMEYNYLMRVKTSITLPEELLKTIDRAEPNRSAFFERAACAYLARLNKEKRDARDLAIINSNAGRLNAEALDVLDYQDLP